MLQVRRKSAAGGHPGGAGRDTHTPRRGAVGGAGGNVAADAETAMARLGQKLAELQAELQVRGRWIHSAHGSGSGATPPVCLS